MKKNLKNTLTARKARYKTQIEDMQKFGQMKPYSLKKLRKLQSKYREVCEHLSLLEREEKKK